MPHKSRLTFALPGLLASFAVTACQPAVPPAGAAEPATRTAAMAARAPATVPLPRVMARKCQGCHSVRLHLPSPNPGAPAFADIANLEGLTPNTLRAFLRDAHNYPDEMKMTLDQREIDEIVAYVVTLRDPDYRPVP